MFLKNYQESKSNLEMFLENSLNSQDVTLMLREHKLCVRRGNIFSATVLLFVYTINTMAQVSE